MTEYERYLVIFTIVGNPVPGEDAFYTDDDVVLVGFYCTPQLRRIGIHVLWKTTVPLESMIQTNMFLACKSIPA